MIVFSLSFKLHGLAWALKGAVWFEEVSSGLIHFSIVRSRMTKIASIPTQKIRPTYIY